MRCLIKQLGALLTLAVPVMLSTGCVRRSMTFNTDPQGAVVHLNDREIGRTPITVDFTWYGDYDVVYRKEGYTALSTHHRVRPPWYQVWPIDFFAEVLTPFEIHDHREVPIVSLEEEPEPDPDALVQRAGQMKERAIFASE